MRQYVGPKISVILSTYNAMNRVMRAVHSVLDQSFSDLELIIVDDASSDKTAELIMGVKDERVRFIQLIKNSGVSVARNVGLSVSQGLWVTFLDDDDWYASDRLQVLFAYASQYSPDAVSDDFWHIRDGEGHPWSSQMQMLGLNLAEYSVLSAEEYLDADIGSNPLYNKSFMNTHRLRFQDGLHCCEDTIFLIDFFSAGGSLAFVNRPYYFYSYRKGSITSDRLNYLRATHLAYSKYMQNNILSLAITHAIERRLSRIERLIVLSTISTTYKNNGLFQVLKMLARNPKELLILVASFPHVLRNRSLRRFARVSLNEDFKS